MYIGAVKFSPVASWLPQLMSLGQISILCSRSMLAIAFKSLHLTVYGYVKLNLHKWNSPSLLPGLLFLYSLFQ